MDPKQWLEFQDKQGWSDWLRNHHQDTTGIWLRLKKKHSDLLALNLEEAVSVALCYGWIDSQLSPMDKQSYLLHFTPRRASSIWSLRNRRQAEELIRNGLMKDSGLKAIDAARESGAWDLAYSAREPVVIPEDLGKMLTEHAIGRSVFESWSNSDRYQVVYWLNLARKNETRQARIQRLIQILDAGLSLKELK